MTKMTPRQNSLLLLREPRLSVLMHTILLQNAAFVSQMADASDSKVKSKKGIQYSDIVSLRVIQNPSSYTYVMEFRDWSSAMSTTRDLMLTLFPSIRLSKEGQYELVFVDNEHTFPLVSGSLFESACLTDLYNVKKGL